MKEEAIYKDARDEIFINSGDDEEGATEGAERFLDREPDAVLIIIRNASRAALQAAIERGDGLSQRLYDFARETLVAEVLIMHG